MNKTAKTILKELHTKFKISDEKLAEKLKVKAITVYRWRLGKFKPSFAELKFLERILRGYQSTKR